MYFECLVEADFEGLNVKTIARNLLNSSRVEMIGIKSEALLLFRKFITSNVPNLTPKNLYPCTVIKYSTKKTGKTKSTDNIEGNDKKYSKDTEEILRYFKHTNFADCINQFPVRILRQRKSNPNHLYLIDDKAGDRIVDLIKDDISSNTRHVIEANAGTGLITEKLLARGVPVVQIMEPNVKFIKILGRLQAKYAKRITIKEADLFHIWKIAYQDKQDGGNRVATLFSNFPHVKWNDKMGVKIVGTVTNVNFIKHVMLDIVRQCGLISYGRPRLYLCMPPSVWTRLTCDKTAGLRNYRGSSVLFQLFFDYQLLGDIPRKAFLPWTPSYVDKKVVKKSRKNKADRDDMYVVKIEAKKNLFTKVIDDKLIQPLWYFINHHMVARTGRIIPQMEMWQPGCGPSMIMRGYNIYTQFGDLSPHEVLELFKEFTTWDGYQNSFIPSMENSSQKMEQLIY